MAFHNFRMQMEKKINYLRVKREEKGKARNAWIFRFVITMSGLRNLQLGNICKTFGILSINVEKTFFGGKML